MSTSIADFCQWLDAASQHVLDIERQSTDCLSNNDSAGYVSAMRQKAEFLATLYGAGQEVLRDLTPPMAPHMAGSISTRLQGFSRSAQNALGLNSVFYMSALLYPEDHVQGQANDLQLFAADCRSRLLP